MKLIILAASPADSGYKPESLEMPAGNFLVLKDVALKELDSPFSKGVRGI